MQADVLQQYLHHRSGGRRPAGADLCARNRKLSLGTGHGDDSRGPGGGAEVHPSGSIQADLRSEALREQPQRQRKRSGQLRMGERKPAAACGTEQLQRGVHPRRSLQLRLDAGNAGAEDRSHRGSEARKPDHRERKQDLRRRGSRGEGLPLRRTGGRRPRLQRLPQKRRERRRVCVQREAGQQPELQAGYPAGHAEHPAAQHRGRLRQHQPCRRTEVHRAGDPA